MLNHFTLAFRINSPEHALHACLYSLGQRKFYKKKLFKLCYESQKIEKA